MGVESEMLGKLDILIRLTAANVVKEKPLREQVTVLSSIGLKPKDIASILGKTPNHISVIMTDLKKKQKGD